jgi:hypothetical protein
MLALMDLDPSPYGVNSHVDAEVIERLASCGLRWHRVDFRWSEIALAPQKYDWTVPDAIVQKAEECGVSLLVCAAYTPRWASRAEDQAGLDPRLLDALPPPDPQHYVDFVRALVTRMPAGGIHCLSLWNEPNDARQFWRGSKEQYVEMVLPALEAVRELAPDLPIAGPDLATWPDNGTERWMNHLLEADIPARYYDVITHHQYGADHEDSVQSRLARIDAFHDFLSRHGLGDKPLWLSETGWDFPKFTREQQAERLQGMMRAMEERSGWWKKTFWYDSHSADWGLIAGPDTADAGQPRPVLEGYAELIRAAGITPPIGRVIAEYRTRLLYGAVLGRSIGQITADAAGLEHNTRQLQRTSTADVCQAFLGCAEFAARWAGVALGDIARRILASIPGAPRDDENVETLAADLQAGRAAKAIAELIESSGPA